MVLNRRAFPKNIRPRICGVLRLLVLVAGAVSLSSFGVAQQMPANNSPSGAQSSTDVGSSTTAIPFGGSSSATAVPFGSSSGSADNSSNSSATATFSNLNGPGAPLPADQIIQILQQNPDLLEEIKSQAADRLQQQGTQVQATDISDEMLYNQIATNPAVRASTSTFLEAHGYAPRGGATLADTAGHADSSTQDFGFSSSSINTPSVITGEQNTLESSITENTNNPLLARSSKPADRGHEESNASTDVPRVLRQPAPYDLPSMRDLYTQIPQQVEPLKRFGSEVFLNRALPAMTRGASSVDTPLAVPLGPDYVIGPGDSLTIDLWGGITQSFSRVIDRDGHILLPEAGSIQVAGLTLERAQNLIEAALKRQYRDVQVSVTISRLRSVRVYVVGDVQRPGGYDISSLATPLSALYAAGGPTSVGSLRIVHHYRGSQLIETVDLYDFLLHGVQNGSARFESGDTLQIPPAGAQVAVSGAIKRPAIYELKPGESTMTSVLADAGGLTAAASLSHITIERIDPNRQRVTVTLPVGDERDPANDQAALDTFAVRDGDRIHIAPILPYSERAVYIEGHVARPGRLPYTEGMRLSDVLRSYQDMLPEPAARGEIVRLIPPDLHAETVAFNVPDVLIGNADVSLQPFDTIHVFGRYEVDTPTVTIHGEVLRPGVYPLSQGMTAAQLVRMAGGFKRDALLDSADLTSYRVQGGNRVEGSLATLPIGAAVGGSDPRADIPLKPGDVLTIHQITGWNDIGQSVTIQGQVRFPGSYGFKEGERLSSVLRRAGGMRDTAYPQGAVLIREQVRELEEKSRQELIRQIETNSAAARLGPAVATGETGTVQLIKAQQEQAVAQLKSHPPTGRMVIQISADIDSWANTPADIELRRGDVLTIPKRPGFVLITGQVYNATALTFAPGKSASWYLSHAGGTNSTADRKDIFIIRANGEIVGRHSGGGVLSTRLDAGDVVVVPQKIIGSSLLWRNLLTTAQLASSIGITAGIAAAAL
jgi:protein involved in polysaccharide export with SLBB domain